MTALKPQLTADEWQALRSHTVISNIEELGGRRTAPYALTEQGVALLPEPEARKSVVGLNPAS